MSFDNLIEEQFDEFRLKTPNYSTNLKNLYSDYIELISLFSNDSFVTIADIQDRLVDLGIEGDDDEDTASPEIGSKSSEKADELENRVRELFLLVEERYYLYGEDYPFSYKEGRIKLKENLTFKNKLYLIFLIASNLDHFSKLQSIITTEFETISFFVLKEFLPGKAIIKKFGKDSDYTGNAKKKIRDLARDLNLEIDEYEINQISDRNNQERGLDIIGWIPFNDLCSNMLIILAQCACGKHWFGKQHDTTRFESYYHFYKSKPNHTLFIPYSLINTKANKFYQSDEVIKDRLVFERRRLIEFFNDEEVFDSLESKKVVQKCLELQEDIL